MCQKSTIFDPVFRVILGVQNRVLGRNSGVSCHFLTRNGPKMTRKWLIFVSFLDPFLAFLANFGLKPAGFGPVLPEM